MPDLALAERVVVVAADGLYAVDVSAAEVRPLSTVDRLRPLGDLTLDSTPGRARRRPGSASADPPPGLRGAGVRGRRRRQAALDLAAAHAKARQQFGRIIGTYQAVSHQIADIFTALSLARSLATWAAWAVSAGDESADLACAAAKSAAGEAAVLACEKAIQVHGGIGFTYEHILHRYYKRAQWINSFEGTSRAQRAELAAALLDAAAGGVMSTGRPAASPSSPVLAGGIGAAVARACAARGDRVVIADVDTDNGPRLAKELDGLFVTDRRHRPGRIARGRRGRRRLLRPARSGHAERRDRPAGGAASSASPSRPTGGWSPSTSTASSSACRRPSRRCAAPAAARSSRRRVSPGSSPTPPTPIYGLDQARRRRAGAFGGDSPCSRRHSLSPPSPPASPTPPSSRAICTSSRRPTSRC